MESEACQTKERLTVERKAQQYLKPAIGDSAGAAWAHMRQRVSRAEREARSARRLTTALFCVTIAAVTGALLVALPRSADFGSTVGAGVTPAWAADAHDPFHTPAGYPDGTQDPLFSLSSTPATPPAKPGDGTIAVSSHPEPASERAHEEGTQTPSHPAHSLPPSHLAISRSGASSSPELQPGHGVGTPSMQHTDGSATALRKPLPLHSSTPASAQRREGAGAAGISRHTARFSDGRRTSPLARSRYSRRYRGHARRWRFVRVSRLGSTRYCLVDPDGNWWVARRARPRSDRRGEVRK